MRRRRRIHLEALEPRRLLTGGPVLAEFMAVNTDTLADEDGDFSDWIEIHNDSAAAVDLTGWHVTNDAAQLDQWTLPATTLAPDERLVVFASGKDRATAGGELHTNFTLAEIGDYLGLTAADATVVSEYADGYPQQSADVSYGLLRQPADATFVGADTPAKVLVPTDGALGTSWTGGAEPLDDSAWTDSPDGPAVGFVSQNSLNGFVVREVKSSTTVQSLSDVDSLLAGSNIASETTVFSVPVIDYFDSGGDGHYTNNAPFPNGGGDDFVIHATANLLIPTGQGGAWTFGVNSDDGSRLRIDGADVMVDDTLHGPADHFGSVTLTEGVHTLDLVFFERGGGAEVELFAAPGVHTAFSGDFDLVGDTAAGGLLVQSQANAFYPDLIDLDLEGAMYGVAPGSFSRMTFDVLDAPAVTGLTLRMQYDDGFVAYLNGTEVARQNAPATPLFDSTATAEHPNEAALTVESFDLSSHLPLLQTGDNALAVHGLNLTAADDDYLIVPQLVGRELLPPAARFFSTPTPGAVNAAFEPIITEFMAVNNQTLDDEDGDSSDWIELHNAGALDASLAGWYLTDDPNMLTRWQLPDVLLAAGDYLVVFASSKDRTDPAGELHTNFKLAGAGEYLALVRPDGATVAWEFQPDGQPYPAQFDDVSFGLNGLGADDGGDDDDDDPPPTGETRGLVAYWDFEDGPTATQLTDQSGNGVDGTLVNVDAADWIAGAVGDHALALGGIDAFIETGASPAQLNLDGAHARTIAGWARSTTPSTNGGVFEVGSGTAGSFAFRTAGPTGILWYVQKETPLNTLIGTAASAWFHYAITYEADILTLYVNGVQTAQRSGVVLNTAGDTFKLGSWNGHFFNGQIDDLAVWDIVLPVDDIAALAAMTVTPPEVETDIVDPPDPRRLGVDGEGFTVRQVNASAAFPGQVTGQIGGDAGAGADPLADADLLLDLPAGDPGVADSLTFGYETINFFDLAASGDNGDAGQDEPFPLDLFDGDEDHFALRATATLVVPDGEAGEFLLAVNGDEGARLRVDGVEVIVDNTVSTPTAHQGSAVLADGEHTLELTFFERTGPAHVELLFASATDGVADDEFTLLAILPELQIPDVPPTIFQSPRVFFPEPTPGAANNTGVETYLGAIAFSAPAGFYDTPLSVGLTATAANYQIYFTTDGSAPGPTNPAATAYAGPIHVATTTTLQAAAFSEGVAASTVVTQTYLFLDDVIRQPAAPAGFPTGSWGAGTADYEMDSDVVDNPLYSGTIVDDLKSIPSISIVADVDDLFGPSGIYSNPRSEGAAWEVPASMEFIDPNGGEQLQVNTGLRIYGGVGRYEQFRKHSFRFLFKGEYGPTKLEFPLFDDSAVDRFDSIILRAGFNNSWVIGGGQANQAQYLRDQWMHDSQLAMGHPSPHGTFVHLYVNGLYWGLYNAVERPNADFASSYSGGEKEDWDNLNSYPSNFLDGNRAAWDQMWSIAYAGLADTANYQQIQGNNPDGTRNPDYPVYVDVDNMIDYMLLNFFAGNQDWDGHNWYGGRDRTELSTGYQWYSWDAERTLESITGDNKTGTNNDQNPSGLFQRLRANAEFVRRFQDRAHMHLVNGVLSAEANAARYQARVDEIERAVVAESARWGDVTRATPYTRDAEWATERDRLLNQYFPQRTDVVIGQLKAAGLYPDVVAPQFHVDGQVQHGGEIAPEATLSMSLPEEDDGSYINTTLSAATAPLKVLVPTDGALGTSWIQPGFDDATGWTSGVGGVGYDRNTDYDSLIGTDVEAEMYGQRTAVYIRTQFTYDGGEPFDRLLLKMKYDDGFVAYLNGQFVAQSNAPGTPAWDSTATALHSDTAAVVFQDFDITDDLGLLQLGVNTLAIHGLNLSTGSSDLIMAAEVEGGHREEVNTSLPVWFTDDGADPRGADGNPGPTAVQYDGTFTLADNATVKARTLSGGQWSALNQALFVVSKPLQISEIHYHPAPPTTEELAAGFTDADQFEFIELINVGNAPIGSLDDVRLVDGVALDFPDVALAPDQRIVVVRDLAAFEFRYGTGLHVAGQYTGGLNNGGESLLLLDAADVPIQELGFDDDAAWPGRADGLGSSLEVIDPAGDFADPNNWRSSSEFGGSPGAAGAGPRSDVVVNEVVANSDVPTLLDTIELHNTTDTTIDLSGWYASDSTLFTKYRIADGVSISAGGYLLLDENDFNPAVPLPGQTPFALSAAGEDVWLVEADAAGTLRSFVDHVTFRASAANTSLGRWPNGSGRLTPMIRPTLGAANAGPQPGDVVISEVMYHPADPTAQELAIAPTLTDDDLEFVELINRTGEPVDMTGWRLDNAVDLLLGGVTLPVGGVLLFVPFDPNDAPLLAAFRLRYPDVPVDATLLGPYSGRLDNGGETLQLERPGAPVGDPPTTPYLLVDEVRYDDQSPWPIEADTEGHALVRTDAAAFGNFASSWTAEDPATPGTTTLSTEASVVDRRLFYHGSAYGDAIDASKTALSPGDAASRASYSNFAGGINGLAIDVARLADPAALSAADFVFHTGNDNDPDSWTELATPPDIQVRAAAGLNDSYRIALTWPDGTIVDTWLRVAVQPTVVTGLVESDVFYFGNAVGETGNAAGNALVTAADVVAIRDHLRGPGNRTDMADPFDVNRDRFVDAVDMLHARNHATSPFTALRWIQPPPLLPAAPAEGEAVVGDAFVAGAQPATFWVAADVAAVESPAVAARSAAIRDALRTTRWYCTLHRTARNAEITMAIDVIAGPIVDEFIK